MKKQKQKEKITQTKWCERCKQWVKAEYNKKMYRCPRCRDILAYIS